VAVLVAHELFTKPIWSHDELLEEWQARVPGVGEDYQVRVEEFLKGIAIRNAKDEWQYFPAEKLAKSPEERLTQLFAVRETWTKGELAPYLEPLTKKVDQVLIKYARTISHQVDGENITIYAKK